MRLIYIAVLCLGCLSLVLTSDADARRRKSKKKEEKAVEAPVDSSQQARKHLFFGHRYLKNKQYEDAETQLTRSWSYDSASGKTAYYLGKLRYQTDEYDQALDWLGKAIELSPESKNTRFAYGMMADIYVMQEQRTEAIETYNKLLPLAPDSTSEIQYRHALVSLFVEDGEYESALEHARRWAELDPDNPEVRDTVAKLALSTGSEDEALAEMERVVEMTPGDFATIERLADIYRRRGSTSKAFSAYEKLHGNDPTNFLFLDQMLTLGRQLGKSKRIQVRLLKKMLALQPQNLGVIEQLADESGSISMVERGLKLDRRNGKLLYMKGDYFYRKWKDKGARQDSVNALNWFRKAHKDPQWAGNAKRMIDELDPPITEEERKLREFFKKKSTKDEADVSGKK